MPKRLQMPWKRALGVRETAAGHRLGALEWWGGGGGRSNASPASPFSHSLVVIILLSGPDKNSSAVALGWMAFPETCQVFDYISRPHCALDGLSLEIKGATAARHSPEAPAHATAQVYHDRAKWSGKTRFRPILDPVFVPKWPILKAVTGPKRVPTSPQVRNGLQTPARG